MFHLGEGKKEEEKNYVSVLNCILLINVCFTLKTSVKYALLCVFTSNMCNICEISNTYIINKNIQHRNKVRGLCEMKRAHAHTNNHDGNQLVYYMILL